MGAEMRLRNVKEAILRFEPLGQDRALGTPAGHGVDYTLLKDLITDHITSLQKLNLKLGASPEIAEKLGELKAAYETVFGKPVVDSVELNEAYEDRVQQVADAVKRRSKSTPFTKEELLRAIESEASGADVAELKFKDTPRSTAWRDFVKDVLAKIKGKIKFSRPGVAASAAARKTETEKKLQTIARIIEDSIGYTFPDGDPIDYIMPRVTRLGIDTYDVHEWLDRAARKVLGAKSLSEYLGAVWDDIAVDNLELIMSSGAGLQNPYTGRMIKLTANTLANVFEWQPGHIVDLLSSMEIFKVPNIADALNKSKDNVIKSILSEIKRNPGSYLAKRAVNNLIRSGIDWHELAMIQKSIEPAKIAEDNVKPGDVFMLEDVDQAVVGTVLSVDNDTLIVEGDVYQFDEQEVNHNLQEAKTDYEIQITPDEYKKLVHNGIKLWKHSYNPSTHELKVYASTPRAAKDLARMLEKHIDFDATSAVEVLGLNEAEYQGRKVQLGKPMRDTSGSKKFKVYVKNPKTGNIKKVSFGDKNMEIKRDDPERRKSFRARHGCGTPRASDRTKAAYWSCRMWSSKPVGKITKE